MPPPEDDLDFSEVIGDALSHRAPTVVEDTKIEERVTRMELALEQVALASKYQTELARYVDDLRQEAADTRTIRRQVGVVVVTGAIILFLFPIAIMMAQPPWFMRLPVYLQSGVIIAMFAAGVLLLQGLAKSVFRSAHERQGDEFIPPQVKAIHELMNTIKPS
ncbi:hypothetical protein [Sphingomonas endophytica]|uniref:Uncharacterized protein n=1 Tax=Sphingomonas endophytica TaxID=869719 RepID=A0A147I9Q4_9SPHN|nr:hypothetical protein [Sphingomonas endophytica]KTT76374.1 hypothetical protein NS334_01170 [Sphingomonas endophytica]